MFRALLAALKPAATQEFVIEFAAVLAQQHDLELDAYAVIDLAHLAAPQPTPIGGSAFKAHRDEQVIAVAREKAADLLSRAAALAKTRNVKCTPRSVEGDTTAVLAQAAQRCDLLVCGHTRGGDASERSLLYSILKHNPRPAIVVPQIAIHTSPEVLIPYDGSFQAARALASFATSGLAKGRNVHLVAFDDGTGKAQAHGETAQMFLNRHGISSDVRIGKLAKDVGSEILDEVTRVAAGLVVMGSFGRGAVREFFIGSATKSMLHHLPVPVFLDH